MTLEVLYFRALLGIFFKGLLEEVLECLIRDFAEQLRASVRAEHFMQLFDPHATWHF